MDKPQPTSAAAARLIFQDFSIVPKHLDTDAGWLSLGYLGGILN